MRKKWVSTMAAAALLATGLLACGSGQKEAVAKSRKEFSKAADEQMKGLQNDMEKLKEEMETMTESTRNELQPRIESWERQYESLERKLESTKVASLEELHSLELGVNAMLNDLRATAADLAHDLSASLQ